jgi:hypothetical protein
MLKIHGPAFRFYMALSAIVAFGFFFRIYLLNSQILVDDEWHAVNTVIGKSYWDLLTHYNPKDYSSPLLNIWVLGLYNIWGWSETSLRIPSLIAGLVTLILLPIWLKNRISMRAAIICGFFMAMSPQMIFYSRYLRGYSLALLFSCCAVFAFIRYLQKSDLRHSIGFLMASAMAALSHPFSIVAIASLFPAVLVVKGIEVIHNKQYPNAIAASNKNIAYLAVCLVIVLSILLSPMLKSFSDLPWAKSSFSINAGFEVLSLISGTASIPLVTTFWILCSIGLLCVFKNNILLGAIFASMIFSYITGLVIFRPLGISAGAVFIRYSIVLVPVCLTLAAVAFDRLVGCYIDKRGGSTTAIRRSIAFLISTIYVSIYFYFGPLSNIYINHNNFMNHSAYQWSFNYGDWSKSPEHHIYNHVSVKKSEIPSFYSWLRDQQHIHTIIEHPLDICDYNNFLYFYQILHRKKTLVGYTTNVRLLGYLVSEKRNRLSSEAGIIGKTSADEILARVANPKKLKFSNMVDVTEIESVQNCGADILVLHKSIEALNTVGKSNKSITLLYNSSYILNQYYQKVFGSPIYEDAQIVCYVIKNTSG